MKQKERLVDLLKDFHKPTADDDWDEEELEIYRDEEAVKATEAYYDELADFCLSNGVIVPPCKVGDTVYCATLRSIDPVIKQETVERIQYTEQGFYYGMQKGIYFEDEVFFAREAAEEALKEREKHE